MDNQIVSDIELLATSVLREARQDDPLLARAADRVLSWLETHNPTV